MYPQVTQKALLRSGLEASTMADIITYICKQTMVSTKPVQPRKYYHLSVLDRQMERNHLRIVFYYPSSSSSSSLAGMSELRKRIRESISEVLSHFPMITGRLQKNEKGQWMIKCNDAGVRAVEARAKGSVEDWLKCVDREKELMLVCWEEMFHKPYFWSTFYVQITQFEEGGFAIGLSCTHLLADATCATMFIKAWADTTLSRMMRSPPYIHPLPSRRPGNKKAHHVLYSSLIEHYRRERSKYTPSTGSRFTTVTLSFTDHMVRACMAMAQSKNGIEQSSLSPFEALAGLFWVCVSKAKGMRNGLVDMSICLDTRKVLGLDRGFFGNCMVCNNVYVESLGANNNLVEAAKAIGEVVAKMDNDGIMDLIESLQHNDNNQSPPLMNGCDLVCANLEVVDPYSVMFEDGVAPVRVSYYVEPPPGLVQVLILPPPPGEGMLSRIVMVSLPDDEVARLCADDLIVHFSPTILMGVNKE